MSLTSITLSDPALGAGDVVFSPVAAHPVPQFVHEVNLTNPTLNASFSASTTRSAGDGNTLGKLSLNLPIMRTVDSVETRQGSTRVSVNLKAPAHATAAEREYAVVCAALLLLQNASSSCLRSAFAANKELGLG